MEGVNSRSTQDFCPLEYLEIQFLHFAAVHCQHPSKEQGICTKKERKCDLPEFFFLVELLLLLGLTALVALIRL